MVEVEDHYLFILELNPLVYPHPVMFKYAAQELAGRTLAQITMVGLRVEGRKGLRYQVTG